MAQDAEISWQQTGPVGGAGLFVQSDFEGNLYVVNQISDTDSVFDIYSPFGELMNSTDLGGIPTGLAVQPEDGTAVIQIGNVMSVFYWDGFSWSSNGGFSLIGIGIVGFDPIAVEVNTIVSYCTILNFTGAGYGSGPYFPSAAGSALVQSSGNVLLLSESAAKGGVEISANLYSLGGTSLFSRSLTSTPFAPVSFAGYVEDGLGQGFIIWNIVDRVGIHPTSTAKIEAIDLANGTSDLWTLNVPGSISQMGADPFGSHLYVAGVDGSGFVEQISNLSTTGQVDWQVSQNCNQLAVSLSGPTVASFVSSSVGAQVALLSSANGSVVSSVNIPASSAADIGGLCSDLAYGVKYVGSTGGANPSAIEASIVFGANLNQITLPATVQGGSSAQMAVRLEQQVTIGTVGIGYSSSDPQTISAPASSSFPVGVGGTILTLPTNPVDANTNVTITATQTYAPVRRSATVEVLTAALVSISSSTTSLSPPAAATVTVNLSGPAGPSGKTIALSASSPAITTPASVFVPPGKSSAAFTATSHPVTSGGTVDVIAKLGSVTRTIGVVVKAPTISNFALGSSSVIGGNSVSGSLTLSAEAVSGAVVDLASSAASAATVPATVAISGTTANFTVTTFGVATSTAATITATISGSTKTAALTIEPASLVSSALSSPTVIGGTAVSLTLTLNGGAPPTPAIVKLSSNFPTLAAVPGTANFGAHAKTVIVQVTTFKVSEAKTCTISATYAGKTLFANLTIDP